MTDTMLGLDPGTWQIDPVHSEIAFNIRHLMTTVRGSFTEFAGALDVQSEPLASSANLEISMASIDTRNEDRDDHARFADFLDVATYPTMSFESTFAKPASVGRRAKEPHYTLGGALTIKDVTRPIEVLTVFYGVDADHFGNTRAGFAASTSISRSDFGIEFNIPAEGGDRFVLGDQIDIALEIQAVRA